MANQEIEAHGLADTQSQAAIRARREALRQIGDLWLEHGRLRDVEPYAGGEDGSARQIVRRTRAVWP